MFASSRAYRLVLGYLYSLTFREKVFSEGGLPVLWVLGNSEEGEHRRRTGKRTYNANAISAPMTTALLRGNVAIPTAVRA
jgi:hypothetical protein